MSQTKSGAEIAFPTTSPFVLRDAADTPATIEGRGRLFPPRGGGRAGVVILPGLGGIVEAREPRYGALLAAHGYAALACDSFGARGAGSASLVRRALTVTEAMLAADACAAHRHLVDHAGVDPGRVAVLGFSYGGLSAVLLAYEQVARLFMPPGGPRFAAHVSCYGCSVARLLEPATTGAPVRIAVGDRDGNVDLDHVRAIAGDLARGGSAVELDVLPGIRHQWDSEHARPTRVRPSPHRLRLEIDPENHVRDTRTGLRLRGPVSRGAVIAAHADWRGYDLLRDEAALAHTDAALLAFLDRALGRRARAAAG